MIVALLLLGIRHHHRRLITFPRDDLHNGPASWAKAKKTRRSRIAPTERHRERESMKPLIWLPWEKARLRERIDAGSSQLVGLLHEAYFGCRAYHYRLTPARATAGTRDCSRRLPLLL
jgi:hypothetical protein